ncbi:MAG: hypothetical protein Q4B83_02570 [Ligilactobacillus murinus]|nr:hypothetical protein [Ligilactobacillus murinus]
MLQESTIKNQENLTSFENLKLGLTSMLKSNDLNPGTAHLLEKTYGKKLFETDHKLYFDPISLASACAIVEATKFRIKQGLITLDEIQVILKNFEPTIKHFDPELYEQLKEKGGHIG